MGVLNPKLDEDVEDARVQTRATHLAGIIKAKAASGNWLAGVIALLFITALLAWGLLREVWQYRLHAQTCQGILVSGLDAPKLEFLGKHCVPR